MRKLLVGVAFALGCTSSSAPGGPPADPGDADPGDADPGNAMEPATGATDAGAPIPAIDCAGAPSAGPKRAWRHPIASRLVAVGGAKHRGLDLVASVAAPSQVIAGEISYGVVDKALEDENVDVFACTAGGTWTTLGSARTDDEGHFELALAGADRLGVGVRDLFVSVQGDRTGTRFVALVAPDGTEAAVSDVDGTLTESENKFATAIVTGADVATQPSAPEALRALRDRGYAIVYLTARGRIFTRETRAWLAAKGFPKGALRLAPAFLLTGGDVTQEYKLAQLEELGLPPTIGIGNKGTDAWAYSHAGIAGDRVFLKNPEFAADNAPWIDDGLATEVIDYADVVSVFETL